MPRGGRARLRPRVRRHLIPGGPPESTRSRRPALILRAPRVAPRTDGNRSPAPQLGEISSALALGGAGVAPGRSSVYPMRPGSDSPDPVSPSTRRSPHPRSSHEPADPPPPPGDLRVRGSDSSYPRGWPRRPTWPRRWPPPAPARSSPAPQEPDRPVQGFLERGRPADEMDRRPRTSPVRTRRDRGALRFPPSTPRSSRGAGPALAVVRPSSQSGRLTRERHSTATAPRDIRSQRVEVGEPRLPPRASGDRVVIERGGHRQRRAAMGRVASGRHPTAFLMDLPRGLPGRHTGGDAGEDTAARPARCRTPPCRHQSTYRARTSSGSYPPRPASPSARRSAIRVGPPLRSPAARPTRVCTTNRVGAGNTLDHGHLDHSQVVPCQLLEPCGHRPAFLQPADAPFDDVATPVEVLVELQRSAPMPLLLIGTLRDHRADVAAAQPPADSVVAIPLVPSHVLRSAAWSADPLRDADCVQHRFELCRLVPLPGRHLGRQGQAVAGNDQVDLGAVSAARAAQRVIGRFLGAPFFHRRLRPGWPGPKCRRCRTVPNRSGRPDRAVPATLPGCGRVCRRDSSGGSGRRWWTRGRSVRGYRAKGSRCVAARTDH